MMRATTLRFLRKVVRVCKDDRHFLAQSGKEVARVKVVPPQALSVCDWARLGGRLVCAGFFGDAGAFGL